jgi:ribonuclease J
LEPLYRLAQGSTSIEIYGGYREIGGNCVVIRDGDRKLVLDNGIRFSILRKYYRGGLQPLGVAELRQVGAVQHPEVFKGADAVYISHTHLDHLGLLGTLPPGLKLYAPSKEILGVVEKWYMASPTWLAEVPHREWLEISEARPGSEDDLGMEAIPISHSSYPSYAYIYRGREASIFYSGDLRVRGPGTLSPNTLAEIERTVGSEGVDIAIIEGTNIGWVETPIGPDDFKRMVWDVIGESDLAVISVDAVDAELLAAVLEIIYIYGRKAVIASPRIADIAPHLPSSIPKPAIALEVEKSPPPGFELVSLEDEILSRLGEYVVLQDPEDFLNIARRMWLWGRSTPRKTAIVLTTPEPLEAGAEALEEAIANWTAKIGATIYRIRMSGHYYQHELWKILEAVKPKKLIPIHTKALQAMLSIFNKYRG